MSEKKANKSSWKPGQSGNPSGGLKLPEDLRKARTLTRTDLERLLHKHLHLAPHELKAVAINPDTSALELMIISIIQKAVMAGDQQRLDFLLNRLVGKVRDQLEVTMPKPTIIKRADGSATVLGSKIESEEEEE